MSTILDNDSTADDTHLLTGTRCLGRGLFWETRTRCERRLVIVALAMVVLIVALVVTLVVLEEKEHQLSDYRLQQLTEELISIDKNNNNVFDQLDITPNGDKLLHGPGTVFSGSTISALVDLQDDFHPKVNVPEIFTDKHLKKQKRFLDAVMDTEVMHRTEKILKDKELIKKPLEEVLKDMWFSPYSRSNPKGVNGSSGFEHVFVGETNKNGVSGFHSWVYFFQEQDNEKKTHLNYTGCKGILKLGETGDIINMDFLWLMNKKKTSSMFIGTSPELEMAVYTICFLARPNKECPVSMAGKHFTIITQPITDAMLLQNHPIKATDLLGTAYPKINTLLADKCSGSP